MEKITKYFTHDYENDTTVEYVNTGLYSMLNVSFTSEDEDAGTETIHSDSAVPPKSMTEMAYEMLLEVADYLDKCDDGNYSKIGTEAKMKYGNHMNSTRIAVENALQQITKDYIPKNGRKWFLTIKDAGKLIADKMLKGECKSFSFCESSEYELETFRLCPDKYEGCGWYGIKRIDGFFDNSPEEFIIACGYYGGGNCTFGYTWAEDTDTLFHSQEVAKAICDATGNELTDIIYLEADKEDENE